MELGGAPGSISANLLVDTELTPYAVDFSDNARLYLAAMDAIGKDATLFQQDVFEFVAPHQFDVVSSFGLVEHFAGRDLDRLLHIHHELTRPGGLVVIEMPNFRGVQRMWHTVVDKPNLDLHNLEAMRIETFDVFVKLGYTDVFRDYFGGFKVWQDPGHRRSERSRHFAAFATRAVNKMAREVRRIGVRLEGPNCSPYLIYIGRKPEDEVVLTGPHQFGD
jgi:hypothetical protein